ncbi:ABC transporter permease [Corynebacterium suedekumii]|nr:ABC transporter permease [Corynebacterium suedekumii]
MDISTAADAAAEESEEISQALSFLTDILLAFGLIALLVGTFIISNTFSMIVAQRTSEFALLRALGMSRRQLSGSVLAEAILLGAIGSAVGILVGVGLVRGIVAGMEMAGFGFPDAGLGFTTASVLVPIGIGVVVTAGSAWAPARRAGRVHPVQAMRMGEQASAPPLRARTVVGSVLVLTGIIATVAAAALDSWETGDRAVLAGVGALGIILGVLLVSAWAARAMFSIRPPVPGGGPAARWHQSLPEPPADGRHGFALTLGVALVAAVGILGESMKESIFGVIDEELRADTIVSGAVVSNQGVPWQAVDEITSVDGVASAMPHVWLPLTVNGEASSTDGQYPVSAVLTADPSLGHGHRRRRGHLRRCRLPPGRRRRQAHRRATGPGDRRHHDRRGPGPRRVHHGAGGGDLGGDDLLLDGPGQ